MRGSDRGERGRALFETFSGLSPERFPLITAHADRLVAGDGDERFHAAVDAVIDGTLARAVRRAAD